MICAVIKGPSYLDVIEQISKAKEADLLEFRIDLFKDIELYQLAEIRKKLLKPVIYTLRPPAEGGSWTLSEESRRVTLLNLLSHAPDYIDLESDLPTEFIDECKLRSPKSQIILSYHRFEKSAFPILSNPGGYVKIALQSESAYDALQMLAKAKECSLQNLIPISMGVDGQISRILSPKLGIPWSYASIGDSSSNALGQLSLSELLQTYPFKQVNKNTSLYGLIGNPVDKSISHHTHNALFKHLNTNAVYVKMRLHAEELPQSLKLMTELGFKGVSVTMPFKETILPYLDEIDIEAATIGAVNTLLFENGRIIGYNTDGIGALNALEKSIKVQNRQLAVIGAGGASRAIVYEAVKRGAKVTLYNRHPDKALALAERFHCAGKPLKEFSHSSYDILINTTPLPCPVEPDSIRPGTFIMDINTFPKMSLLLKEAEKRGAHPICGYEMFIEQALGQFNLWLNEKIKYKILEEETLRALR